MHLKKGSHLALKKPPLKLIGSCVGKIYDPKWFLTKQQPKQAPSDGGRVVDTNLDKHQCCDTIEGLNIEMLSLCP